MVDQGVTGDDLMRELVDDINQHLDKGTGVIVHCGAGYGRAGIVCISVLTSRGMGLDDAVAAVRAARPRSGTPIPFPRGSDHPFSYGSLNSRFTCRRRSCNRGR